MTQVALGKHFRQGMSLFEVMDMFSTEGSAREWFEAVYWPNGRKCGRCGSCNTVNATHKTMPYWCTDCRSYFSVKAGICLAHSRIPLRKWVLAVYLFVTSLKGVSSMKLHRNLKSVKKQHGSCFTASESHVMYRGWRR